jgi:hypothetical protein
MSTPSLRRLWSIYKAILIEGGATRREQIVAQGAFYSGAWGILESLNQLVKDGDTAELERVIRRHASTISDDSGRRFAQAAALDGSCTVRAMPSWALAPSWTRGAGCRTGTIKFGDR